MFLEVREKELTDNFRLIRAALERRSRESGENGEKAEGTQGSYSFDTVCIREGMENPASVTLRCLAAIPKIARAEYVFVNESSYFLSSLPLRPETTVIQTWHACGAFKKFGYSAVGKGFGTSADRGEPDGPLLSQQGPEKRSAACPSCAGGQKSIAAG